MTSLPITAPLAKALAERNYTELTTVQTAVLAPEAAGRDLLVSAQTGSGKTVAFGISIGPDMLGDEFRMEPAADPLALVVAPTRELALQVQRELEWLYAPSGARVVACVGGMDPRRERRLLEGGAHIVVGTPGRLRDHIERKALILGDIRAVVLDEADEMLDLGFRDDIEFILETTPETRRTLLFSATLPRGIVALAGKYQRDAFRIAAAAGDRGHADIEYRALRVAPKEVEYAIVNVLRQVDSPASIVFCNTRDSVRHLQAMLVERGFSAVYLSGELSQSERNQSLQALRDGRARVCVATDVAARGIDLPNLNLVIHADLPLNAEILQHRSGRTGRAGRKGISALVVPQARYRKAERLIAEAKLKPQWMDPPSADDIRALDRERFLVDPLLTEEVTDEDRAMAQLLIDTRPVNDIAAILAKMYRSRLPEPEELSPPMAQHQPRGDRNYEKNRDFDRDRSPSRGPRERDERGREPRGREERGRESFARDQGNNFERDSGPLEARGDSVIFRMNIGRHQKADPKWLLPMICRRGNITRQEIGTIRILDETTEFEITKEASEHFALHASRKDGEDITITSGTIAPKKPRPPRAEGGDRKDFGAKRDFGEKKPYGDKKPYGEKKSFGDKPRREERMAYEDRPPHGSTQSTERPSYGAKPAYSDKPSYSKKPAYAKEGRDDRTSDRPARAFKADDFAPRAFESRGDGPRSDKPRFDKKPGGGGKDFGKKDFGKKDFGKSSGKPFGKGPKSNARSGFAHRKKDG
ncbi:MAG: DEAD/DEAH box helicase [Beijerinckiaceae bacterium]